MKFLLDYINDIILKFNEQNKQQTNIIENHKNSVGVKFKSLKSKYPKQDIETGYYHSVINIEPIENETKHI